MRTLGKKTSPTSSKDKGELRVKPMRQELALLRLPKKFSRKDNNGIVLPDDYDGCPNLGWISDVGDLAAKDGIERGMVVFYDQVLGREVTTDRGVYVFIHKDDLIAHVEVDGMEDVDWKHEALKSQGVRVLEAHNPE